MSRDQSDATVFLPFLRYISVSSLEHILNWDFSGDRGVHPLFLVTIYLETPLTLKRVKAYVASFWVGLVNSFEEFPSMIKKGPESFSQKKTVWKKLVITSTTLWASYVNNIPVNRKPVLRQIWKHQNWKQKRQYWAINYQLHWNLKN